LKQNNKKLSIKWRLFIYLSIFTAVTLLLLWLLQVVLLDSIYKTIKIDRIKLSAESIGKNIDDDDLQELIERISQDSDISVIVVDEAGKLLHSSETIPGSFINRMTASQFYSLIENAQLNGGAYMESTGRKVIRDEWNNNGFSKLVNPQSRGMIESIVYTKLVTKNNGIQVAIVLNAIISPVNATVQTIRIQLIFVTIIMLIFALVLALIISKKISKPIIRINTSSKELAKGNYQVHFDTIGYREIAELGETLNYATIELSKTENLRRELIANISHDLRTPLTMITGYAEIMRDLPGENIPENLQIIIDEAKRLETLVDDMLDISKLRAGVKELNIEEYNFTESIRNILKRYVKLIKQDGYTIKFIYDSDVLVKADELKISQVIYNLINNSITHTGKNKSVIVRQSINNGKVRLEVIDTGEGIPEDKFKDIWDRYYKVDIEHKRAKVGTGLGLSIVKTILEMHHATYGVKSDMGQGSIFWFELNI
jgi:signal transduction histidine kinase